MLQSIAKLLILNTGCECCNVTASPDPVHPVNRGVKPLFKKNAACHVENCKALKALTSENLILQLQLLLVKQQKKKNLDISFRIINRVP